MSPTCPTMHSLRRSFSVVFSALFLGLSVSASGGAQSTTPSATSPTTSYIPPATETHASADSVLTAAAEPMPTPLMMAGFPIPTMPVDLQSFHLLHACQSMFEREVRLGSAGSLAGGRSTKRRSAVAPSAQDSAFVPMAAAAVTVGRQCLARIGNTEALPPIELPFLLRFAVGINDDTLARRVVARQLAIAGSNVRDRGRVLETAINVLLHNQWEGDAIHRTHAHDSLALRYAAQLDTMQPVGQVLASRLRLAGALSEITAPSAWNADRDIAEAQAIRKLAMSVPMNLIPAADTERVRLSYTRMGVAWATFIKTPTHANLAEWIAVRDSVFHRPKGTTIDSLINRPAPHLDADHWFNLPAGTASPPVIPAPGVVSLLVFVNEITPEWAAQLQHLHTQYPALHIVLATMTSGAQDTPAQVAQNAARIAQRFTDVLHWPVSVGVLETKYHTESDASDIPVASPVLDRFHLDPRQYAGNAFLVDAQGWLLDDRSSVVWNDHLMQALFAH